jgi:hypothetical protein
VIFSASASYLKGTLLTAVFCSEHLLDCLERNVENGKYLNFLLIQNFGVDHDPNSRNPDPQHWKQKIRIRRSRLLSLGFKEKIGIRICIDFSISGVSGSGSRVLMTKK